MEIKKGIYRHYKGNEYEVLEVALHSETLEKMVLYRALYPNELSMTWVRPIAVFNETVEIDGQVVPRFSFEREIP